MTSSPAAAPALPAHVVHAVPAGLTARGSVVIVPGRGENASVYTRLATRLTVDAYRVAVLDDDTTTALPLSALVAELAPTGPAPLVLIGSDTGALAVHDLAAKDLAGQDRTTSASPPLAGVVLAGLPLPQSGEAQRPLPSTWDDELDARTACPVHRARLDGDPAIVRGAVLHGPVEDWTARRPSVPALVLHGAADVVSPLPLLRNRLHGVFDRIVVVENGRHDVLNDLHHRSAAAAIVQFLEALRRDPLARPVLTEVTP